MNEKNLYLGMDYLLNKSKVNDLKGDTLIIDEYGEVEDLAYNLKSKKEVKDSSWNMRCILYTSTRSRDYGQSRITASACHKCIGRYQ
ncbi:hypothetical protein [Clostridioides difficile]|uniref:hypothetical protein n=1 Tax=Clostridioides difficile TaxID=1496 RepID=UPI000BC64DC7|nr:hypothetical protein [Clostridioides difficile]PBF39544.1 hypothetical protein BGU46_18830 [Clostridioides difficile]